ncbi:hypothetical protein PAT3040_00270 [Paenibacillus agaridevorans]|uniref:Uncharacterized protein n=1 Tax=Paenibacillus agaridevorans TaxID=171404 RepID=A0A2R5EI71_9BACL|nr:hypothetical protein [Paenibacillus agaridevorans]GBG05785.1 hypothetical protein PAT3040_00270 [Paenibacillus agaridevorans]
MDPIIITEEEMVLETEEFSNVYPILINQIDHIEQLRGKLNDFQLMLAVSRAKDAMSILGWERRQTVNAILERYAGIYREYGRDKADGWVLATFGFVLLAGDEGEENDDDNAFLEQSEATERLEHGDEAEEQIEQEENDQEVQEVQEDHEQEKFIRFTMQEISSLIAVKEAELLQLYREFYRLSKPNS